MVEPCRDNHRIVVLVLCQEYQERFNLCVHLDGRTILMYYTIRSARVIWKFLEFALKEWNFLPVPELVHRRRRVLVTDKDAVKLMNEAFRKRPIPTHTVQHKLDRGFLISQDVD